MKFFANLSKLFSRQFLVVLMIAGLAATLNHCDDETRPETKEGEGNYKKKKTVSQGDSDDPYSADAGEEIPFKKGVCSAGNCQDGKGKMKVGAGEYEGHFVNGLPHGKGKVTYEDGTTYEGAFKKGLYHGYGTYKTSSDYKYEGMWKLGRRHGMGTQTYPGGMYYVGAWKGDLRHGEGMLMGSEGKILGQGEWADGELIKSKDINKEDGQNNKKTAQAKSIKKPIPPEDVEKYQGNDNSSGQNDSAPAVAEEDDF